MRFLPTRCLTAHSSCHPKKTVHDTEPKSLPLLTTPCQERFLEAAQTCLVNDKYEEVVAYNDIVDYIEADDTLDGVWKFRRILDHKCVTWSDKNYMQCSVNVLIKWESGETSWQPLHRKEKAGTYDCDPVAVAIYARENSLLDAKGWKLPGLKKLAKTQKHILRLAKQAKLHSFRTKPIYMYGFEVPRNHEQAMAIDCRNGNTKFADAENAEIFMIDEFSTFEDLGFDGNPGSDYKKIRVHVVYAVKHDGRHKARLVAGGHLTETPIDSIYSSVVSLRGIRLLTFVAELNDLEVWATDIGNAYLESYTQEKVYIVAGPEFGDQQGHTLVIHKALHGLKSSSLRWHERLSDVLCDMGFIPSKAERDIWMLSPTSINSSSKVQVRSPFTLVVIGSVMTVTIFVTHPISTLRKSWTITSTSLVNVPITHIRLLSKATTRSLIPLSYLTTLVSKSTNSSLDHSNGLFKLADSTLLPPL